jgi:hypothetical protein
MNTNEPKQSIVEFASGATTRFNMTPAELASDLHMLGKQGADWPRCSVNQWLRLIHEAITDGRLVVDHAGRVGPPAETTLTQPTLF